MPTTDMAMLYYNSFIQSVVDHTIDLENDTINCALFTAAHVPSATDTTFAALTGETLNANGYASGGKAIGTKTWTNKPGTNDYVLDGDDVVWTATGGTIVAKYYVMYSATATGNDLIAYGFLDAVGQDEKTTPDTRTLTLQWHPDGVIDVNAYDTL